MQYYLRERLWKHAENIATELATRTDVPMFRMWRGFCLDMQNLTTDAIHEYRACEGKRDVAIAALMGMGIIYRRNKDREGERSIEDRLAGERTPQLGGWLQAASMLWHSGDVSRAREVVNSVLDSDAEYRDEFTSVQLVRGWMDLCSGRGAYVEKSASMFDRVLQTESAEGSIDIDAQMGKIAYLERKSQYWPAQELLNKIIVSYQFFTPAIVVKAKQLLRAEDWDQAAEVTQRILARDSMNVEALIIAALYPIVKEGRHSAAATVVSDLFAALRTREPRNVTLYLTCAQSFSRLTNSSVLLAATTPLAEYALQLAPNSSDAIAEVAHHQLVRGDVKSALASYKRASTAGDANMSSLLGLIRCYIITGNLNEAAQNIEFVNEIQTGQVRNVELLYLAALIKWRRNKSQSQSLEKLDQAVEAYRQEIAQQQLGVEMYGRLNPSLIIDIAREYTQHCRTEPPEPGQHAKGDPILEKARRLLEQLLRYFPGNAEAQLLYSRLIFVSGDVDKASVMISQCIRQDQSNAEAHMLASQIHLYANNLFAATQSLDMALSLDFEVKDQPHYNLIRGMVHLLSGHFVEAAQALSHAQALVEDPRKQSAKYRQKPLSIQDHVSIYLQHAQTLLKIRKFDDAKAVIAKANDAFRDTPQGGRITIAHAMILSRTDVDKAIELLRAVPLNSEFALAAKSKMASLYLTHHQNRRMYAQCFEELAEVSPTVGSLTALGEAYMQIQDPERAIAVFEKAQAMEDRKSVV